MVKKGETIKNKDGSLYCTFLQDFMRGDPMSALKVEYADGSIPIPGTKIEGIVMSFLQKRIPL